MPTTFISYRQLNVSHVREVHEFAERLKKYAIEVILDQFFKNQNPGGPDDKWTKWSCDQAAKAERVIIIGSQAWFNCYDGTESRGVGLGAACEAAVIRQRIYDAGQLNHDIRIVFLNDADSAAIIPIDLRGYHRFSAVDDFHEIVAWITGGISQYPCPRSPDSPTQEIHGFVPRIGIFYGRNKELQQIADALDPDSRTWGVVITGPGGMGKTSLAIRAAQNCQPGHFKKIVFVSVKEREMDDDRVRQIGVFLLKGFIEMLNELSRLLDHPEIVEEPEHLRITCLHNALKSDQALLILDNLESLTVEDRSHIRTFLHRLPQGCKAIVTSRSGMSSGEELIDLEQLDRSSALQTIKKLSTGNALLERSSEAERISLYEEVGGNPLLLHWVVRQVGSDRCLNIADAISRLKSCPSGNDPLEFILGDLVGDLSEPQVKMLCTLNFFSAPVQVRYIAPLADLDEARAGDLLKSLTNLKLVIRTDQGEDYYALVPLAASYLRNRRPDLVANAGDLIQENVYSLIVQYGGRDKAGFDRLENVWAKINGVLPLFTNGSNEQLQVICDKLWTFFDSTNRSDEWFALSEKAEQRALASEDHLHAGWRAFDIGCVHRRRGNAAETIASAYRADCHWDKAQDAGPRLRAYAARLRGHGHRLEKNFHAAIAEYKKAVKLLRSLESVSKDLADALRSLGEAQRLAGELETADLNFREALQIAKAANYPLGVAKITARMAELKLDAKYWQDAEALARESLDLAVTLNHSALIAEGHWRLARAMQGQGRIKEAIERGRRAIAMFAKQKATIHDSAQAILDQWEKSLHGNSDSD